MCCVFVAFELKHSEEPFQMKHLRAELIQPRTQGPAVSLAVEQ